MTPAKPISTAPQRRQPTCSPSNGGARAVMNNGPAKVMAMASARGRKRSPVMNKKPLVKAKTARRDWPRILLILSASMPPARHTSSAIGRNTNIPLTNIIWPTG